MKAAVILPAAGAGRRFAESGPQRSKLELELNGRAVLLRSVLLFAHRPQVAQIIVAAPPDELDAFNLRWGDQLAFHGVRIVAGGRAERWETVANAIKAVAADCTHIAVHDAARPLASDALITRVFDAAAEHDAVIPAVDVSATLKRVTDVATSAPAERLDAILGSAPPAVKPRRVVETLDRRNVVAVQTPQVFAADLLRRAYAAIERGDVATDAITDDAGLVEALGEPVMVVEGEETNLKITRPADAELAEAIVSKAEAAQAASLARKRLFADDAD
jgi:2-C-methyl-D-erythritol 4-phosphate cytidylyltransferase